MISAESGQMLQKTVPSIMQVKSDEKPTFTGPAENETFATATVSRMNAMVMERRFVLELKSFSICVST